MNHNDNLVNESVINRLSSLNQHTIRVRELQYSAASIYGSLVELYREPLMPCDGYIPQVEKAMGECENLLDHLRNLKDFQDGVKGLLMELRVEKEHFPEKEDLPFDVP